MRQARILVVAVVAAALSVALVLDQGHRPVPVDPEPGRASVPVAADGAVWFCPGGSGPSGPAGVAIELINAGGQPASVFVSGVRSGTGEEPRSVEELLDPGERRLVPLADLVPDSAWMGAVVEVDSGDVVVDQTFIGATGGDSVATGSDRAPCHTRTATSWIVASGATRVTELGEEMTLLVLNPFLDDAVLDIRFDSDVGVDSLTGVVVPARRVLAIDITEAVTVASRVSAVIDVVAGRVAVSRLQVIENEISSGLAVTPASADAAAVWYLPTVRRGSRNDVVTVVNPSTSETAKVDLEITADGTLRFDPIELTIRPGRSVAVAIADEVRLEGAGVMTIVARSLNGLPVAVMNESTLPFGGGPVSNFSSTVGADAASTRWIAPVEADEGAVVIFNPSETSIATASVSVISDGELQLIAEVEVQPRRRAEVASGDLGGGRPIVVVDSTSPVVVGREFSDVSVHGLSVAIATGAAVSVID
jgi:hypothetical protein